MNTGRSTLSEHFTAVLVASLFASSAGANELPFRDGATRVGAASCASATCHGALQASSRSRVLQNEFETWKEHDAHSNAYRLLLSARGRRIAGNLGLEATRAPECLGCHTDHVPDGQRGSRYRASDGVSCEACHGGADPWLGTHSEPARTPEQNIAAGMYPLADPERRAQVCLQCHLGGGERTISHRIMSAGHPQLSFELDTFTAIQPAHFRADQDYAQRKTARSGAYTWVIGQLVASQLVLDGLLSPRFEAAGRFPEFTFFDCHACHRSSQVRASGADQTPGTPRLALTPLVLAGRAVALLAPELSDEWQQALRGLAASPAQTASITRDFAARSARALEGARERLSASEVTPAQSLGLLQAVAETGEKHAADLSLARQVSMALGTLCNDLVTRAGASPDALRPALEAVFDAVQEHREYDPRAFGLSVRRLREVAARHVTDGS